MKTPTIKVLFLTLLLTSVVVSASTVYLFLNPTITKRTEYIDRNTCEGVCLPYDDIEEVEVIDKDYSNATNLMYLSTVLWVLTASTWIYYSHSRRDA